MLKLFLVNIAVASKSSIGDAFMNVITILIGSAESLVAISGAQAADAIVAPEPEAVEYVRVCDAYGAGYFYIPGTETCLRIHGYVRYDASGGDNNYARTPVQLERDTWNKLARSAFVSRPLPKRNSARSRPIANCVTHISSLAVYSSVWMNRHSSPSPASSATSSATT